MPEIPAQAHATILREIRNLNAKIVALDKATEAPEGYLGFEWAEVTLGNCHEAINETRDPARIVKALKTAYAALAQSANGPAAAEVQGARKTLEIIWKELAPKSE
jgi:hypothetical protein